MDDTKKVLNQVLVNLFNDIYGIEEKTLKNGPISDLSLTEIHTIEAIGMYVPRSMSEVAQDLSITVGTLTSAINKLIKKGYVTRKRIEEDRRVVLVTCTKKGKLAYRLHRKFHSDMVNETIKEVSVEDREVLIRALMGLNDYFISKYKLNR